MNGKEDGSVLLLLVSQWNPVRVPICLNLVLSYLVKRTAVNLSISAKKMPDAVNNFNTGQRRTIPPNWSHTMGTSWGATTAQLRVLDVLAIAGDLLVAGAPPIVGDIISQ